MLQVRKSHFVEFLSFSSVVLWLNHKYKWQFLIFWGVISRNHFLEGDFTFQWAVVFQMGGFIFKWGGGRGIGGGINFDGGEGFWKIVDWMGTPQPTPLRETLGTKINIVALENQSYHDNNCCPSNDKFASTASTEVLNNVTNACVGK